MTTCRTNGIFYVSIAPNESQFDSINANDTIINTIFATNHASNKNFALFNVRCYLRCSPNLCLLYSSWVKIDGRRHFMSCIELFCIVIAQHLDATLCH